MEAKLYKIARKYVEFVLTKVKILYAQHSFQYNDIKVKYMLKKNRKSKVLVIVFSACTRHGLKARYNYVKTLDGLGCNRLYILDDYGEDGRGSYYLGKNFSFEEEKATEKLIQWVTDDVAPEKIIYCGSSKGGYAALNFGLQTKGSYIIAGAPQFFLASYLKTSGNLSAYRHILGNPCDEKDEYLNQYLRNRIINDSYFATQRIYLHFSKKEHTYSEHVQYLIEEIERKKIVCECDVGNYTDHSEISYFFPDYLRATIRKIQQL